MKIDSSRDQGKITAFLNEHPEFVPDFEGRDICLAGYGGSFSYGTNIETSDIDIRGVYMNPAVLRRRFQRMRSGLLQSSSKVFMTDMENMEQ